MKKLLVIIVSLTFLLNLTACGADKEANTQSSSGAKAVNAENESPDTKAGVKKYSITIDGEEYNFPMSYEKFKSYGWVYYIPKDDDVSLWRSGLGAGMSSKPMHYSKGNIKYLAFLFYNPAKEPAKYDKCQVIGVTVDYGYSINGKRAERFMNIPKGSIVINHDVLIGESTKEQVHKSLGKDWSQANQKNRDYKDLNTLVYSFSDEQENVSKNYMTLNFDKNGVVNEFTYHTFE